MVHGDDFVAVGPDNHLKDVRKALEDKYKLKVKMLGIGPGKSDELRILNKVVRVTTDGIELEADPRHSELVVKELGLENSKTSAAPGHIRFSIEYSRDLDSGQTLRLSGLAQAAVAVAKLVPLALAVARLTWILTDCATNER